MKNPRTLLSLALLAILPTFASCTVIRVGTNDHPPSVVARGLIDGHLAFGMNDESRLLDVDLFDGRSSGAFFELVIWKLFRIELGVAGVAVGIGPVDAGLGVLFYDPEMPDYPPHDHDHDEGEDDEGEEGEEGEAADE